MIWQYNASFLKSDFRAIYLNLAHMSGTMLECSKACLLTTCSIMSVLIQSDDVNKGEGHDAIALAGS